MLLDNFCCISRMCYCFLDNFGDLYIIYFLCKLFQLQDPMIYLFDYKLCFPAPLRYLFLN